MNPTIYRYPLDGTGASPDNLVKDEEHQLSNRTIRCVAPTYGGFFADSVVVVDAATNLPLAHGRDKDYIFGELYEFPTGRYGKEIFGLIVIKKPGVSKVKITYQALGGDYSYSMDAIIAMIDNLNIGDRPVAWPDIIGKPALFDPASHFHDLGDVYGFEYIVQSLERVRSAILLGDTASHDEIYRYVDKAIAEQAAMLAAVRADLTAHIADKGNPHAVTKAQVGLGNVANYPVANQENMNNGSGGAFLTPDVAKYYIDNAAVIPMQQHINNTSNPHNTTKAQVGLDKVVNLGVATQQEMDSGATTAYVTPNTVRAYIQSAAVLPLTEHMADRSNPHATTKAQIGLSLVDNYATATDQNAVDGVSNTSWMTPRLVRSEIQRLAIGPLDVHVNRSDNPHSTTKAQVGLSNVQNYPVASEAEMAGDTANDRYTTPYLVAYRISSALQPVYGHMNNTNNPHNTTKAQVGLSNLQNYPVANNENMLNGNGGAYLTPDVAKWFIDNYAISPLYTHINRGDNPHNTTKAQVGLGNVENYGIASVEEMDAGATWTKYTSPGLVNRFVSNNAVIPLNNHIGNTNNPHNVTKAQVGLSLVNNFAMASIAEMDAGASSTLYVSPALVNRYVSINAYQPLQQHIGNTGNPHGTTAAQVGLGNVANYPVANDGEAQNGNVDDRFMTPYRVRQWTENTYGIYLLGWKATLEDAVAGQRDDRWVSPYGMQQMVANRLSSYYTRAEVDWLINDVYNRSNNTVFTYGADVPVYQWTSAQGVINNAANYFDVFPPQGKTMSNIQAFTASNSFTQFNGDVDDNDTLRCQFAFQADRVRVWTGDSEQRAAPRANWMAIWK